MKIPRSQLASILTRLSLAPGADARKISQEIAAYLLSEKRTGELDSLLRDVIAQRAEDGIVEVTAVSARELTPEIRADIRSKISEEYKNAKQIIINERIDHKVVGGVRLELIDRQLDLSVRAKLNHFKQLTTIERTT
jgi:F0F1-type ATP synthase delta subunit